MVIKVWLFTLGLILSAGGVTGAPRAEFVYAATSAGSIYQYRVGVAGALVPLSPSRVEVSEGQRIMLALHPSGKFVYAVTIHSFRQGANPGTVLCYHVKPNGTLAEFSAASRMVATAADNVTMDPRGRFLLVSGENGRLFTFRIQPSGMLQPLTDNKVVGTFSISLDTDGEESTGAYSQDIIAFDPAGRFLYVFANTGFVDHREFQFAPYRLDTRGRLHSLAPVTGASGENSRAFTTSGGELFVNRSGDAYGARQFHIGRSGLLSPASSPVLTRQYALFVTKDADKETLWTENQEEYPERAVVAYRLHPNGRLTLQVAEAAKWKTAEQIAVSRAGHFLFIAQMSDDGTTNLVIYAVMSKGTLKLLGTKPQALPGRCVSLTVNSLL